MMHPGSPWRGCLLALLTVVPAGRVAGAQDPAFADKRVPFEEGFRVFIVPDMEGMGSAVHIREVIAGNEAPRYAELTGPDYWGHFRSLLTQEVNAVIEGARAAGARSFVVNEGHGGNLFANVLPWELDQDAILIRGYPKPLVMITGIDESFGTMVFTGAHANAGSPGVMAHNFAFDEFTVNGKKLNEVGINALIAGEMGVSVSVVSGDDVLVAETREMLGNGFIGVVVKTAVGRNAAITHSPTKVRELLRAAAEEAVRREMRGDFPPLVMEKPYRVAFTLRASFPAELIAPMTDVRERYGLEQTGERSYRLTTDDAKRIGYVLDAVEEVVLR
jgi:D-amino peptidase